MSADLSIARKRLEVLYVLTRTYKSWDKLRVWGCEDKLLFNMKDCENSVEVTLRNGEIIKISKTDFEEFRHSDIKH